MSELTQYQSYKQINNQQRINKLTIGKVFTFFYFFRTTGIFDDIYV